MIADARHTPKTIARNAFFQSMSSSDAISAPVHAPVPGSGIPTKSTSPKNSYFSILSLLLIAFSSSFSTKGRNNFVFLSHLNIGLINHKMNGIGIKFPIRQMGIALQVGMSRKAGPAASSPPLSSNIGTMEMINIITSFAAFPPK